MKSLIDHLFDYHKVQLAVFPEFISFLKGRKKIIRIVVDNSNNPFNHQLFNKFGFIVKETLLFSSLENNSFGNLVSSVDKMNRKHYNEVKMFSISKSIKDLDDFEFAEVHGDILKAGKYLGYPKCCINNVEKINILNGKWATFYLNDYRNNVSANYFTNRFPITWGGISIIGELFPCSLICPSAIKYSKTMHSDVINFGFNEIAKVMVEHALKPIYINEEDGSISTIFKEGTDLIKFS